MINKISKTKVLVLFTVFIDIIGIGIIIPTLPFYVQSFGVSDTVVTLLFTIYALLSFVSAPYLGSLSDKYGRRPILIVSILSSAIGWLVFASAKSVLLLFVGRIIDGLAAGNISSAQSALADIAKDEKERAQNMGLIGALFGLGFIIGPFLGGLLGNLGHTAPFWFVGILAMLNTILAYFFLPETHHTKQNDKIVSKNPIKPIVDGFKSEDMRTLFFVFFVFGTALSLQQSIFSLYMNKVFGMNAKTIGFVMAGIGILLLINQLVLLRKVWLKFFKERNLAKIMLIVFSLGIFMSATPVVTFFFVGLFFTTISQGNLRTVFMSMISGYNQEKRGEYIGISASIMSLSMIVGPLFATILYPINPYVAFISSGILMLCCYPFISHIKRNKAHI